ncbi:MAG: Lrp/AsnC ligand binding domain-containing protein [Actinomycetota bacterium]|nr:Lrp/AsnC family transcriptional regulator [Actinomycetota bacterium]
MDVFLFIKTEPGLAHSVMNSIVDSNSVTRAAVVTGSFDVFARIDDISWDQLAARVLEGVQRTPGVVRTESAVAIPPESLAISGPVITMPLRGATTQRVALVFASLDAGTARSAVPELVRIKGVLGLALISGKHDLILQVAGRGIEQIAGTVVRRIQEIPGVRKTSTALVLHSTPRVAAPKRRRPRRR